MSNYRNPRKRQIVYRVLPRTTIKSNSKKTSCSTTIFLSILCKTGFIFSALSFNSPLIWPRKFCICFCLGTVVSWGICNSLLTCYNVSSSCYIYWWSISVLVFSEPLISLVPELENNKLIFDSTPGSRSIFSNTSYEIKSNLGP